MPIHLFFVCLLPSPSSIFAKTWFAIIEGFWLATQQTTDALVAQLEGPLKRRCVPKWNNAQYIQHFCVPRKFMLTFATIPVVCTIKLTTSHEKADSAGHILCDQTWSECLLMLFVCVCVCVCVFKILLAFSNARLKGEHCLSCETVSRIQWKKQW